MPEREKVTVFDKWHSQKVLLMTIVHPQHPLAKKQFLTAKDFSREHI
jgi:hypothetical protein